MKIFAIFSIFLSTAALAAPNDFYADLLSPQRRQMPRGRYEFRKYEDRFAAGKPYTLEQHRMDASVPFAGAETAPWRVNVFSEYDGLGSTSVFPNGRLMPNRLWDIGAGISHSKELDGGKVAGGSFTLSSASERPYSSINTLGFNLNLFFKLPQENNNSWILFMSLSNTRGFMNYMPMPGAAYLWNASPELKLLVGVPFLMAFWMPATDWSLMAFYFPIRTFETRLTHGSRRGFQQYALVSYKSKNYWLSDRADSKERLFFDEGLVRVGVTIPMNSFLMGDLSIGNSFARRYYLAQKATERKDAPNITGDNAIFGQVSASF